MPSFDTGSGAGVLRLAVGEASQDIATNTTQVSWYLALYCGNGSSYNFSPTGWSVSINGTGYSGSYTFDFRGTGGIVIASGTTPVVHNADGTKTISVSGYSAHTGTSAIGGPISAGGGWTLTTIPRATTPVISPSSGDTGSLFTITHTPATSTFYHDVAYSLDGGTVYTDIATNVAGTTTTTGWTPAHTLLPDTGSATAIIRVITRATSGGTIIGTKTTNLPLTVPASVKPTISSVSWVDDQTSGPDMPTLMGGAGRFVQRWSKLKPTVTSAGAGGSTIVSASVTQNGQTTASGAAFGLPIAISGSVPYSAVAVDSRVRSSDPYVNTVAVTAYNFPSLPTPTVTRTSDAGGTTPSPIGTYLKITPLASVSSLDFSGEKNLLEWQIRTRPTGGSWTTEQAWTAATVSGTTWTTPKVIAGYASSSEFEVEVSIRDLFGKNGYNTASTIKTLSVLVPSEFVFMDWDGNDGIGVGGYRRGTALLDVHGELHGEEIYQNGNAVLDVTDLVAASTTVSGIAELATSAETITGTDTTRVVTPAGMAAVTATDARRGLVELATSAEVLALTDTERAVTPAGLEQYLQWGWQVCVPSSISSSGSTATLNTTTGIVTVPASCTGVILNGVFTTGWEYLLVWRLTSTTIYNCLGRYTVAGVPNSGANYQFSNIGWAYTGGTSGGTAGTPTTAAFLGVIDRNDNVLRYENSCLITGAAESSVAPSTHGFSFSGPFVRQDSWHSTGPIAVFDGIQILATGGAAFGGTNNTLRMLKRKVLLP